MGNFNSSGGGAQGAGAVTYPDDIKSVWQHSVLGVVFDAVSQRHDAQLNEHGVTADVRTAVNPYAAVHDAAFENILTAAAVAYDPTTLINAEDPILEAVNDANAIKEGIVDFIDIDPGGTTLWEDQMGDAVTEFGVSGDLDDNLKLLANNVSTSGHVKVALDDVNLKMITRLDTFSSDVVKAVNEVEGFALDDAIVLVNELKNQFGYTPKADWVAVLNEVNSDLVAVKKLNWLEAAADVERALPLSDVNWDQYWDGSLDRVQRTLTSDADIARDADAFESSVALERAKAFSRLSGSMANSGAVNGSAFTLAQGLLARGHAVETERFTADLILQRSRERSELVARSVEAHAAVDGLRFSEQRQGASAVIAADTSRLQLIAQHTSQRVSIDQDQMTKLLDASMRHELTKLSLISRGISQVTDFEHRRIGTIMTTAIQTAQAEMMKRQSQMAAVTQMMQMVQLRLQAEQTWVSETSEARKTHIIASTEEQNRNIELRAREQQWYMARWQHVTNAFAALSGASTVYSQTIEPVTQTKLGARLAGLVAGAQIGAVGGPFGSIAGAIIGASNGPGLARDLQPDVPFI